MSVMQAIMRDAGQALLGVLGEPATYTAVSNGVRGRVYVFACVPVLRNLPAPPPGMGHGAAPNIEVLIPQDPAGVQGVAEARTGDRITIAAKVGGTVMEEHEVGQILGQDGVWYLRLR